MSTKSILLALAAAGTLACTAQAHAGGHVGWSVGINLPPVGVAIGAPAYPAYPAYQPAYPAYQPAYPVYAPAPVYSEPAPVYAPAPVYYGPNYYGPSAVVYGSPYYYGHRHPYAYGRYGSRPMPVHGPYRHWR